MTLKGHKNHYNIKLFRGYGVSINLTQNKIILKNGSHDITGKQESEEWFVTKIPYEKIVISGEGYVSTEAIPISHVTELPNDRIVVYYKIGMMGVSLQVP